MQTRLLDHAKKSTTDAYKNAWKRAIQNLAGRTGDFIGNKNSNRITKVSKTSQQNNSEKVTNEQEKEIPKKRYVPPGKRQKTLIIRY